MKALIIGCNSNIGEAILKKLSIMKYNLILVDKNKKKLEKLKGEINTEIEIICMDISSTYNCKKLFNKVKQDDIDVVINCVDTKLSGEFIDTKIDKELDLIDLNIKAVHTLTKLFLKYFDEKNKGYILNISSLSAFSPKPLMATYAACKTYVLRFTVAINKELKVAKKNIYVGCFCPDDMNNDYEGKADIAIEGMFKRKTIIISNFKQKLNISFSKLLPRKNLLNKNYKIAKKEQG